MSLQGSVEELKASHAEPESRRGPLQVEGGLGQELAFRLRVQNRERGLRAVGEEGGWALLGYPTIIPATNMQHGTGWGGGGFWKAMFL